jgi:hypothetical protein
MRNFTISWKPFTTKLDGDDVTMLLLPLKRKEMFALTPLIAKHSRLAKEISEGTMPDEVFEITEGVLSAVSPWIDLHVKDIEGFTVNDGAPMASQLLDEACFSNLMLSVVMELFMRSTLKDQESRD